jgi:hypothetical protein
MDSQSQRLFRLSPQLWYFYAIKKMKPFALSQLSLLAAPLCLALVAAGCDRDSVKVYKVDPAQEAAAQAQAPSSTPMAMLAGDIAAPDNSNLPKVKYTLPAGWQEKPASQFRVASFEVAVDGKKADVSVIPLGGSSGGDLANVNRWRRDQLGLPPVDEAAMKQSAEPVEIAGTKGELYDLEGANGAERILGAMLHTEGTVWFFKMFGDSQLVQAQKANFVTFLKSVELGQGGSASPAPVDMSQLPPGHPAIPGMTPAPQPAANPTNQ